MTDAPPIPAAIQARSAELRANPANGQLATIYFLASEGMFFLGMVFVVLAIRRDNASWPPPGSPQLDLVLLVGNTLVLLASSVVMSFASRAARAGLRARLLGTLALTTVLASVFLAVQLVQFQRIGGWQPADSVYRTLFQILAGLHGVHILAGMVLLVAAFWRAWRGRVTAERPQAIILTEWYWHFVGAVWLVLLAALLLGS